MPSTPQPQPLTRTSTQVGVTPRSALEDPEVWEKVLHTLAYGTLGCALVPLSVQSNAPKTGCTIICVPPSLNAAMSNDNAFSSNPITKVPPVITKTTAFFAVWLTSLQVGPSLASFAQSDFAQSDTT